MPRIAVMKNGKPLVAVALLSSDSRFPHRVSGYQLSTFHLRLEQLEQVKKVLESDLKEVVNGIALINRYNENGQTLVGL